MQVFTKLSKCKQTLNRVYFLFYFATNIFLSLKKISNSFLRKEQVEKEKKITFDDLQLISLGVDSTIEFNRGGYFTVVQSVEILQLLQYSISTFSRKKSK